MIVQLRIYTDTSSTTVIIPEVIVIRPNNGKIALSLKRSILETLNKEDLTTILIAPTDNLKITDKGYAIKIGKAVIERVSL